MPSGDDKLYARLISPKNCYDFPGMEFCRSATQPSDASSESKHPRPFELGHLNCSAVNVHKYITRDQDDPSASIWRFLVWVAFDRNLAGPYQITDDERLRCPMLWCRCRLGDQVKLLEHVFKCAHMSDGRYWCFHCQKEESFTPLQCKHCQVPAASRKERLSVRAKRLFRWLGPKPHQKDHDAFDPSAPIPDNQYSRCMPDNCESLPAKIDNTSLRKPGDDYDPNRAELNGSTQEVTNLPAELDSGYTPASTFELDVPFSRSKSPGCPESNESESFALDYANTDAAQAQSEPSLDIREPPNRSRVNSKSRLKDSLPRLQSSGSPKSTEWPTTSCTDTIPDSPTSTDFSSVSVFTKSFRSDTSPPSTRNSTMQNFFQSPHTAEKRSEYIPIPPSIPYIRNEAFRDILEHEFTGEGLARNNPTCASDPFHLSEIHLSACVGTNEWLSPRDLLQDFWNVLSLHVAESSVRLNMLPDSPVINDLVSMTTETIAYAGVSAWQKTLSGSPPATITELYALVHISYACAIVIFDGQIGNHMEGLFTRSLAIEDGALSIEDKLIYTKIVWSIWSPPVDEIQSHFSNFSELNGQSDRLSSDQLWDKRKAVFHQTDPLTQSLHVMNGSSALESHSDEENELLNVLAHFLDRKSH
jgi:hypothetical protein